MVVPFDPKLIKIREGQLIETPITIKAYNPFFRTEYSRKLTEVRLKLETLKENRKSGRKEERYSQIKQSKILELYEKKFSLELTPEQREKYSGFIERQLELHPKYDLNARRNNASKNKSKSLSLESFVKGQTDDFILL